VLCDECHQRPATVHVTRIVNGDKTELNLCEPCALEKGELPFMWEPQFSIHHFLAGLLEGAPPQVGQEARAGRCPACGLSYAEFGRTGLLGCPQCYEAFRPQLEPLLRRIHGASRHVGKAPRRGAGALVKEREVERLRRELQDAVQREDFERAARLRDRIRDLEGRGS
jgi:protein arginine kinase activator